MVYDPDEKLPLLAMLLHQSHCASLSINMLEYISLLQIGLTNYLSCSFGDHQAFVYQQLVVARDVLVRGKPIMESGVLVIVILENCLEELIHSEICDENDKANNIKYKRSLWSINNLTSKIKRGEVKIWLSHWI